MKLYCAGCINASRNAGLPLRFFGETIKDDGRQVWPVPAGRLVRTWKEQTAGLGDRFATGMISADGVETEGPGAVTMIDGTAYCERCALWRLAAGNRF